jgi:hypothetical protein
LELIGSVQMTFAAFRLYHPVRMIDKIGALTLRKSDQALQAVWSVFIVIV